jgi:recombination protein RecT
MATPSQAVTKKADLLPAPMVSLMQQLVPDCTTLLPPDITTEQFRAALWLELTGRPQLHDCTPQSLRECVVKAATYGLMPGRDCHFLPFSNRRSGGGKVATYVPNYQGIILALERTGKVRRAFAHPVHEGDEWQYDYFSDRPVHKPAQTVGKKQGPELFYYGAIQFKDGSFAVEVLTLEDLEKIKRSSPAHEHGPWIDWPEMMKRKTALKRVAKYVRLTPQQAAMLDEDEVREREDIPAERHRQNIVDLFGDGQGGYAPPEEATSDAREGGQKARPPRNQGHQKGDTQDAPNLGHPGAKSEVVSANRSETGESDSVDRETGELFDAEHSAALDAALAKDDA